MTFRPATTMPVTPRAVAPERPAGTRRRRAALGILAAAAAAPLLSVPAMADAPKPTAAPSSPASLKVLNWNTMLLGKFATLSSGPTAPTRGPKP